MSFRVVFGFEIFTKLISNIVLAGVWYSNYASASQNVTLALNPSSDPSVAGCRIYFGQQSHLYSAMVDAGNASQITITLPVSGATYYLAATTYDASGDESAFSDEAVINPSSSQNLPTVSNPSLQPGGAFGFDVVGTNGNQYVVQASTNLTDWVSLQTNAAPFSYVDTNALHFSQRFYRSLAL